MILSILFVIYIDTYVYVIYLSSCIHCVFGQNILTDNCQTVLLIKLETLDNI